MKYLVVNSNKNQTLCDTEKEAIDLLQSEIREGSDEADLSVYVTEPINFSVERIPVVSLQAQAVSIDQVPQESEQPVPVEDSVEKLDHSASFADRADETSAGSDPFSSEQVFSLDS